MPTADKSGRQPDNRRPNNRQPPYPSTTNANVGSKGSSTSIH